MFYLIDLTTSKIVSTQGKRGDMSGAFDANKFSWVEKDGIFIEPKFENGQIVEGKSLDDLKQIKYAEIDAKSDEIISKGFTYADKVFSLSSEAQARMTAVAFSDAVLGITPAEGIPWNTKDNTEVYVVAKAKVLEFCTTGFYTIQVVVLQSNEYKTAIRAMTDKEEVKAYRDPRKQTGE